jgi:hypothetical protein
MAAFFKALVQVLVELIRGEIKTDVKSIDADAPPPNLRKRFNDKLKRMRDEQSGIR